MGYIGENNKSRQRGYKKNKIIGNESVLKIVESFEETSKKYKKTSEEREW